MNSFSFYKYIHCFTPIRMIKVSLNSYTRIVVDTLLAYMDFYRAISRTVTGCGRAVIRGECSAPTDSLTRLLQRIDYVIRDNNLPRTPEYAEQIVLQFRNSVLGREGGPTEKKFSPLVDELHNHIQMLWYRDTESGISVDILRACYRNLNRQGVNIVA